MARSKGVDISMIGDKKLVRKFRKLDVALQKKIARKGLRAGAKIIAERASDLAPKHTGRLSASIKVRSATGQFAKAQNINVGKGSVGVVVATGTREELGIPADEKSYYPSSQEFGWTPKKGPQAGQYFPGKPYMRPALDEKRDQARAKAAAIIADGIEREAKRG